MRIVFLLLVERGEMIWRVGCIGGVCGSSLAYMEPRIVDLVV